MRRQARRGNFVGLSAKRAAPILGSSILPGCPSLWNQLVIICTADKVCIGLQLPPSAQFSNNLEPEGRCHACLFVSIYRPRNLLLFLQNTCLSLSRGVILARSKCSLIGISAQESQAACPSTAARRMGQPVFLLKMMSTFVFSKRFHHVGGFSANPFGSSFSKNS